MENQIAVAESINQTRFQGGFGQDHEMAIAKDTLSLPAEITRKASLQTYYTIRFLVDRDRVTNAYRAYAYFRWIDDMLDEQPLDRSERIAFIKRQQFLADKFWAGESFSSLCPEETMLEDLIRSDPEPENGLRTYIDHMMAVMAFDVDRRAHLICDDALETYTQHLAVAVTEALHYFIGHDQFAPQCKERYFAVTAAHITHMLRDTFDDISKGYINVPGEFLTQSGIDPADVLSTPYRAWVKSRVQLARHYFKAGRDYLMRVESRRCRMAGYAYMARFEHVLDAIESADYRLRPDYKTHKLKAGGETLLWCLRGFA